MSHVSSPNRPRASGGPSRRRFSTMLFSSAALPFAGWFDWLEPVPEAMAFPQPAASYPLFDEASSRVLPEAGIQSRIALRDSILRLVEYGAIDRGKFFAYYGTNGPHPDWFTAALGERSPDPMLLTRASANYYVNLLWPIGLSTHMAANAEGSLYGDSLYGFASTGGWTLGKEENGGVYFDKLPIVDLTPEAEARVVAIAKSTYRPCCNNSTFFQDCNHGSALLGLLQLGASQGLDDDQLYREALAFNSFWFPDTYVLTALYFKAVLQTEWADIDPRVVMGFDYSAAGPWQQNVAERLAEMPGLLPPAGDGGAGCGV